VTVLLLTGFLATILMRVLKNDFVKYSREDDGAAFVTRHILVGFATLERCSVASASH